MSPSPMVNPSSSNPKGQRSPVRTSIKRPRRSCTKSPRCFHQCIAATMRSLNREKIMALYVHEAGPADAPSIVFLHGLGISSVMWQPQIERLSHDYHCLAPDLPEHGKSTDIGLLTLENTSRVVAHLIRERIPHGRAHVVGLSLGGLAALGLLRDVPEVIDHLLVSGCGTAVRLGPIIAAGSLLGKPLLHLLKPAPLLSLALRQSKIPQPYLSILQEDVRHLKPEAILHFAD